MVHPVGNQITPQGLGLASTTVDIQKNIPNAAIEVTATSESQLPDTDSKQNKNIPLEQTLESLNENLQAWATGLKFEIDDDLGRVVVSIIDAKTGDVLRKVPSDTVLKVAKMIVQMQGTTINTQA